MLLLSRKYNIDSSVGWLALYYYFIVWNKGHSSAKYKVLTKIVYYIEYVHMVI